MFGKKQITDLIHTAHIHYELYLNLRRRTEIIFVFCIITIRIVYPLPNIRNLICATFVDIFHNNALHIKYITFGISVFFKTHSLKMLWTSSDYVPKRSCKCWYKIVWWCVVVTYHRIMYSYFDFSLKLSKLWTCYVFELKIGMIYIECL